MKQVRQRDLLLLRADGQLQQRLNLSPVVSGQGTGGVANGSICAKSEAWPWDLHFVLEGNTPFQLRLVKMKVFSDPSSATPFPEP